MPNIEDASGPLPSALHPPLPLGPAAHLFITLGREISGREREVQREMQRELQRGATRESQWGATRTQRESTRPAAATSTSTTAEWLALVVGPEPPRAPTPAPAAALAAANEARDEVVRDDGDAGNRRGGVPVSMPYFAWGLIRELRDAIRSRFGWDRA